MIVYICGHIKHMISVTPTHSGFQNNYHWALDNKIKGKYSVLCSTFGTLCSYGKAFTKEGSFLNKTFSLFHGIFWGLRSHLQYKLYIRSDDEITRDSIEKPLVGNIGIIGAFIETKINPFALPLASLTNKNIHESYHSIAHLANALYWRGRPASIKLDFDSLKYKLRINLQLLFDRDPNFRHKARNKIIEILSPILGLVGFSCIGLFVPIRSWNYLKGTKKNIINSLASTGNATQHIYYLFKFTLTNLFDYQIKKSKDNLILFSVGAIGNFFNITQPIVDLLPISEKVKALWQETAQGFGLTFFGIRRNILGRKWLESNS